MPDVQQSADPPQEMGSIQIGGTLALSQLRQLRDAMVADGAGEIAEEEFFGLARPLRLVHSSRPWGAFPALQEFCVQAGLTWQAQTEHRITWWEPSMRQPTTVAAVDSQPFVSAREVAGILASGGSVWAYLDAHMPVRAPALLVDAKTHFTEEG